MWTDKKHYFFTTKGKQFNSLSKRNRDGVGPVLLSKTMEEYCPKDQRKEPGLEDKDSLYICPDGMKV